MENKAKLPSREYDSLNSFNHCKFIIIYMFCFIHSDSTCAFPHRTALHTIGNSLPSLSLWLWLWLSRARLLIDQLCLTSLLCDLVLKVRILSSVQIYFSDLLLLWIFDAAVSLAGRLSLILCKLKMSVQFHYASTEQLF